MTAGAPRPAPPGDHAAFLADLTQALHTLSDADEVQATAAALLGRWLEADRCAYADVEDDQDHFTIAGDYTRGDMPHITGRFAMSAFGAEALRLMRRNRPYAVDDAERDERLGPEERAVYRATHIRAVVSVPLHREGRFVAGMAVHQRTPRAWSPAEIDVIRTAVHRCWESSQRARAEAALREREARYHALFRSIDEGYCLGEMVLDERGEPVDYRFLEVNPVFEEMTGLAGAEGRTARELVPDLEPLWVETYARVALGGEPRRFEERSDAMGRVFDVFAAPVEPRGRFAVVFRDITERVRAEEARRAVAERDRFRADLSDALRDLSEPAAMQRAATGALADHLGVARVAYAELAAGAPPAPAGFDVEALAAGRTFVEDGGPGRDAHVTAPLIEDGRLVAVLRIEAAGSRAWSPGEVALAEEVAERIRAAIERARGERALRESEERFRRLADTAPDLIWLTDAESGAEFLNAAYERFVGRPMQELVGSGWTRWVHPEDAEPYLAAFLGAVGRRERFEAEFRLRRHDGEYRWMRSVGVPRFEGGVYGGYVGSTSDIHEARLERDRQALLAAVAQGLDEEMGVDERLTRLTRLLVDEGLADHCRVSMIGPEGVLVPGPRAARTDGEEALIDRIPHPSAAAVAVASGGAPVLARTPSALLALAGDQAPEGARHRAALGAHTAMVVPLAARGRILGVLGLSRAKGIAYGERDLATAVAIGGRAGLAIDNAALYEAEVRARARTERERRRVTELHGLASDLSGATTLALVAQAGTDAVRAAAGADRAWLAVPAQDGDGLTTAYAAGHAAEVLERLQRVPADAPLPVAEVVRSGRARFLAGDAPAGEAPPGATGPDATALAVIPVGAGALELVFDRPRELSPADRQQLVAMGRLIGQALERAGRYEWERDLSTLLQRSLLPSSLPVVPDISIASEYRAGAAGTEAGGDWYDALLLSDGRLALSVGDVVGRGPSAATVMGQMRSALRAYLSSGLSPSDALTHLNEFAFGIEEARATTALCLIIDPSHGVVTWARAGHPPPLVIAHDAAEYRDARTGPLLGVVREAVYRDNSLELPAGGALVAYSDGLVERRGEELGASLDGLAAVASAGPRTSAEAVLGRIRSAFLTPHAIEDDVVVLAVVRLLPSERVVREADPRHLRELRAAMQTWVGPLALPAEVLHDLTIGLGEALANAAEHAYRDAEPGPVELELVHERDGRLIFRVTDHGAWRPAAHATGEGRGHGLALMRAVMDDVVVSRSPTGTVVELCRRAVPGEGAPPPPAAAPVAPPADGRVEIHEEHDGDRPRLVVRGDIDRAGVVAFREAVFGSLDGAPALALDLTGTGYMGSAGVQVIADAARRARGAGGGVTVRVASGGLPGRLLSLTGLDREAILTVEGVEVGSAG